MTSVAGAEAPSHAEKAALRISSNISVMPFLIATREFSVEEEGATGHYLGSFMANVEAFIAEDRDFDASMGHTDFNETGPVVEVGLTFSVDPASDVAAAMHARDRVPSDDSEGYDETAEQDAEKLVDDAIAEHLRLRARATGRLFRFGSEDASWAR